jgi:hypothetical protein
VPTRLKSRDVFINCPFDSRYEPIFTAIVFAVYDLGFVARCSLEEDDGAEFRFAKIARLIEECRYGINDLSAVELSPSTGLPRFNMPLELGLFLGCKRYGSGNQNAKRTLIFDSDKYRYREFISDISGQDIRAHTGDLEIAIREVRDWLQATSRRAGLIGGGEIVKHFRLFKKDLPIVCKLLALEVDKLTFLDLSKAISDWLKANR